MATLYRTDGMTETVSPKKGKKFTLAELQHYVGGYIQLISTSDNKPMYVNEEGMIDGLPYNYRATEIVHPKWNVIVALQGPVLVMDKKGES